MGDSPPSSWYDPPERVHRRGDTLYCYCDNCDKDESFSVRELQYEGGGTGYTTCPYCEMELCSECVESSECYEKNGKKFNHEGNEIVEQDDEDVSIKVRSDHGGE